MTLNDIDIVQQDFEKITPIRKKAAALFYRRLFQLDPTLKKLFKTDLDKQGEKLMQTLGALVAGLKDPDSIIPLLEDLGHRHVSYGVKSSHYDTVGEALLWTLEQSLQDDFTAEDYYAWANAYGLFSHIMVKAADTYRQSS